MSSDDILKSFLEMFNYFDDEYVIRFGYSRVKHNLSKTTKDFDIYVSEKKFNKYIDKIYPISEVKSQGKFPKTLKTVTYYFGKKFEIFLAKDYMFIDIININDINYVTKKQLIKDYENLNRKKDNNVLLKIKGILNDEKTYCS